MPSQIIPLISFIPILFIIGIYDLKYSAIPNKITYPSVVLAIVLNVYLSDLKLQYIIAGGLLAFIMGLLLMNYVGAGGGDVKLMALIGFMFGLPWFLAVIFGGFMIGGAVMLVFRLRATILKNEKLKKDVPLAIYMAVSGITISGWLIFVIGLG